MAGGETKDLGVVTALGIYPVKSMGGVFVDSVKLSFSGLAHDREYAFLRENDTTGMPWLSARQFPGLLAYAAHVANLGERDAQVRVITPVGEEFAVDDPALTNEIAGAFGEPLRLVKLWRRTYDSAAADVSVITVQSIDAIAAIAERSLEFVRFRPNIVVSALAGTPFREEKWVGSSVVLGDGPDAARLRLTRKDPRCRIVSMDPASGVEDARVHKAVVATRKNNLGAYATVERTGLLTVGCPLRQRS